MENTTKLLRSLLTAAAIVLLALAIRASVVHAAAGFSSTFTHLMRAQ